MLILIYITVVPVIFGKQFFYLDKFNLNCPQKNINLTYE